MRVLLVKPLPDRTYNKQFNNLYSVGTVFNAARDLDLGNYMILQDIFNGASFTVLNTERNCFKELPDE